MPDKTLFTRTAPRSGTALVPTLMSAVAVTLTLTLMLSGCGGGGSGSAPATPSTPSAPSASTASSDLTQGRWVSSGLNPAYTAIMVPAPTGANTPAVDTVWALAKDASTLIKLKANGSAQTVGAVTGNVYALGTVMLTAVTGSSYTIQPPPGTGANPAGQQISIQPLLGTTALFDRSDVMGTPLRADQANGRWQADLSTAKVNWTVQTAVTGNTNLNGTSTTGCTYRGQSTVVASQSLYKVQFTETCPGSGSAATQTFNGVATLSADDARLSVVATNEAETRAAALLFVKQP